jgi:hypothetical protein
MGKKTISAALGAAVIAVLLVLSGCKNSTTPTLGSPLIKTTGKIFYAVTMSNGVLNYYDITITYTGADGSTKTASPGISKAGIDDAGNTVWKFTTDTVTLPTKVVSLTLTATYNGKSPLIYPAIVYYGAIGSIQLIKDDGTAALLGYAINGRGSSLCANAADFTKYMTNTRPSFSLTASGGTDEFYIIYQ